jgi:hypothetical protein
MSFLLRPREGMTILSVQSPDPRSQPSSSPDRAACGLLFFEFAFGSLPCARRTCAKANVRTAKVARIRITIPPMLEHSV